jgi:hypothetical protein
LHLPRPFFPTPHHSEHLANHMMELLGLLSCALVLLQDLKLMYDQCISLFHNLKAASKYFVMPAILLF